MNLRCSLLKERGWNGLSSGSGHEGVIRFTREAVDAVVIDLDDDGAEADLIAGELKRLRPEVPIVIVVTEEKELANGATQQASGVVMKSQEAHTIIEVLQKLFPAQ